jgi:hypothetical protein
MDTENNNRDIDKIVTEGLICKSASVESQEITEGDLNKINKFTLSPLTVDDIFTFKLVMGDNELDDRNYEPFNLNALKDLKRLYIGKTMIKDHRRTADNQIARVYDTELVQDNSKLTEAGEIYTKLIAKCYMVKTDKNADLISEIKAGIKKEVSTSCKAKHAYCSICGVDNMKDYCSHYWGREYETQNGKKVCYFTLDGAKEAYEVSFVAVPAQPRAGTTKNYGGKEQKIVEKEKINNKDEAEVDVKINEIASFLFVEKEKEGK